MTRIGRASPAGLPDRGRERPFWRREASLLAGICLLAVALHAPMLAGGFIDYDDGRQVYNNPVIKDLTFDNLVQVTFSNFRRTASSPMHALNMLNWALGDGAFWVFSLFNLLWLVLAVLVFDRLAARFLSDPPWRLGATLLFAVHAVHVDAIGWISARCHLVGLVFVMLSLIAWSNYTREALRSRRVAWYLIALVLGGVAVWNKSIFVVVAPFMVLFDLYQSRRVSLVSILDKLPLFAVALFALTQPPNAPTLETIEKAALGPSIATTLMNDCGLLVEYLRASLIPGPVTVVSTVYPVTGWLGVSEDASLLPMRMPPLFNAAVLGLVLLAALWAWRRRCLREPLFALLFGAVALAPVMNIPPRWVEFAYRFALMPSVFVTIGLVALLARVQRTGSAATGRVVVVLFAGLCAWHAVQSAVQSARWTSPERYFTACTESFPDSMTCHQKLGAIRLKQGDEEGAIEAFTRYDELRTTRRAELAFSGRYSSRSGKNLGDVYYRMGLREEAVEHYERALLRDRLQGGERRVVRDRLRELKRQDAQ